MKWIILIIKSVNVSSRDRMFIWRTIKNTGAVPLSHSVYLLQDNEENRVTTSNIAGIVRERNGEVLQFFADAFNKEQEKALDKLIGEEIASEIKDFSRECKDFISEITERISNNEIKIADLEELNDELHKLDKWRIKLIQKHNPGTANIGILNEEIGKCKERLNDFEEKVLSTSPSYAL